MQQVVEHLEPMFAPVFAGFKGHVSSRDLHITSYDGHQVLCKLIARKENPVSGPIMLHMHGGVDHGKCLILGTDTVQIR